MPAVLSSSLMTSLVACGGLARRLDADTTISTDFVQLGGSSKRCQECKCLEHVDWVFVALAFCVVKPIWFKSLLSSNSFIQKCIAGRHMS